MRRLSFDITRVCQARLAGTLAICVLVFGALFGALVGPAGAQTLDEIASTIDRTGRYLEVDLEPVAIAAIDRANVAGIGFIYLDQENAGDLPIIATGILDRLDASGSSYRAVIVLDASGLWVESLDIDAARAADASTAQFARGAVAGGTDTVIEILGGGQEAATNNDDASGSTSASGGGGVPWLLIILLGLVVFFAVRWLSGRKRKAAALEAALAEDRAEIREQLRNNSDHVIDIGDRIANADDDLRRMYEEAAQSFQDVSLGLEDASTSAEIDALDDRLDRADWLFDVIEARLDGRTPPPEPSIGEGPKPSSSGRPGNRQPVPPLGGDDPRRPTGPALDDDTPLFPGDGSQRPTSNRRPPQKGESGGMLGGLAKAGLLSLAMKLLLGAGLANTSRRTQQRQGESRSSTTRGDRSGRGRGGLGGGVLR